MNSYLSRYFEMSNSPWSIGVLIGSMYGILTCSCRKNQPNVHKYTDTWELRHLLSRWYKYTIFPSIFWHPTNVANQNVIGALDKNKDWANRSGDVDISDSHGWGVTQFHLILFQGFCSFFGREMVWSYMYTFKKDDDGLPRIDYSCFFLECWRSWITHRFTDLFLTWLQQNWFYSYGSLFISLYWLRWFWDTSNNKHVPDG